jgi:serine protease Do
LHPATGQVGWLMIGRLALLVVVLSLVLVDACAATSPPRDSLKDDTVQIYKKVARSTVFIRSTYLNHNHSGDGRHGKGVGSGILLDADGFIVTSAHVVYGAAKVTVRFQDNIRMAAEVVGIDHLTDLALLKGDVPKGTLATVQFGDSDRLQIGERVLAIGHPFGLGYALTNGVVSGFGTAPGITTAFYERVIQTSAAINPGSSGGPLIDTTGRVIGINTAMLAGAQNIGFAIPINTATEIIAQLKSRGRVIRPWLGVAGKMVTEEIRLLFALPLSAGFMIEDVAPGSPAEKAGLRGGGLNVTVDGEPWVLGGDIIRSINDSGSRVTEEMMSSFRTMKVGQSVTFEILRDGKEQRVNITLAERPQLPPPEADKEQRSSQVRPLYEHVDMTAGNDKVSL